MEHAGIHAEDLVVSTEDLRGERFLLFFPRFGMVINPRTVTQEHLCSLKNVGALSEARRRILSTTCLGAPRFFQKTFLVEIVIKFFAVKIFFPAHLEESMANRVYVLLNTKRFVKHFNFVDNTVLSIAKYDVSPEFLGAMLRVREEVTATVPVPKLHVYDTSSSPFFYNEDFIHGRQASVTDETEMEQVFQRLFAWYESQNKRTEDIAEYTKKLSLKIFQSPFYKETQDDFLIDELCSRISQELQSRDISTLQSVKIHGDLNLFNIIISKGGPVLIDWEMVRHASILHDVCTLCVHTYIFQKDLCFLSRFLESPTFFVHNNSISGHAEYSLRKRRVYLYVFFLEKLLHLSTCCGSGPSVLRRVGIWRKAIHNILNDIDKSTK